MLRVDTILFSNVTTSIQRTANLTGGAVRGLPGGNVIEGLKGINSFQSEMAEAQKEFHQGRLSSALARVRQMEMNFNGIAGRWNGSVGSILSAARSGKMNLSLQKLNEVKNAQAKMQQLTGPVNKTFRDLISALDHAAMSDTSSGPTPAAEERSENEDNANEDSVTKESAAEESNTDTKDSDASPSPTSDAPDPNLLGDFAGKYVYGAKLRVRKDAAGKARLEPKLEKGGFYFFQGWQSPGVIRIREIHRQNVVVFDPRRGTELSIDPAETKRLIQAGIWRLEPR